MPCTCPEFSRRRLSAWWGGVRVLLAVLGASVVMSRAADAMTLPDRGLCAHRGASGTHPENTMPALSETAAKLKRRRLLGVIAGTLLFTACSNTENFSIQISSLIIVEKMNCTIKNHPKRNTKSFNSGNI